MSKMDRILIALSEAEQRKENHEIACMAIAKHLEACLVKYFEVSTFSRPMVYFLNKDGERGSAKDGMELDMNSGEVIFRLFFDIEGRYKTEKCLTVAKRSESRFEVGLEGVKLKVVVPRDLSGSDEKFDALCSAVADDFVETFSNMFVFPRPSGSGVISRDIF